MLDVHQHQRIVHSSISVKQNCRTLVQTGFRTDDPLNHTASLNHSTNEAHENLFKILLNIIQSSIWEKVIQTELVKNNRVLIFSLRVDLITR